MRSSTIILAVGLFAAPLAFSPWPSAVAQTSARPADSINGRPLQDAPVPRIGPAGVSPADRVAGPGSRALESGPVDGTPFSSTPSGTLSGNGSQADSDRGSLPTGSTDSTPNLSR